MQVERNSSAMTDDILLPSDTRSPVFIGGQRRSGTTLLRILLNRHPHIACGRESHLAKRLLGWHDRLADEWSETVRRYGFGAEAVDRAFAALFDDIFTGLQLADGKQRWAEKTPANIIYIDYLFRLFPNAQFVHMIRDPRDTYRSIRDRALKDRPNWVRFSAAEAAQDWRAAVEAGMRWRQTPGCYLEVRYEDLARQPEWTMRRVLEFLNEPWDARLFATDADGPPAAPQHGPVFTTSIGRWRAGLSDVEVAAIQSVAGELMEEFGYELAELGSVSVEQAG
jgi:sulfotransferase family protein